MKPLKLLPSTILFISAAVLLWIMTHLCIPFLSEYTGWEPILFWFICGGLGVFTRSVGSDRILNRRNYGCDASPCSGLQPHPVVYDVGAPFVGQILVAASVVTLLVAQYRRRRVLLARSSITSSGKSFRS